MTEQFANAAASTLNGAIDNAVTSLTLVSAAAFPATGTFRLLIDNEILLASAVAGNVLTVTRGTEGTTAAAHTSGTAVVAIVTAGALAQLKIDAASGGTATVSAVDWAPIAAPDAHAPSQQTETTTTDATVTTALSFSHVDQTVVDYTATVLGRSTAGDHFRLDLRAAYASTGGSFTTIDTPSTSNAPSAGNPAGWAAVFDLSGTSVRVRVTGAVAKTVKWSVLANAQVIANTATAFTIASESLTLWLTADFTASPWTSTASAGTSGGRTVSEGTNPPTSGVILGAKHSAAFNGTNQKLTLDTLVASNLFAVGAGGIMILYRANAGQAVQGANATADVNLLSVGGAYVAVGVSASTLSFYMFDTGDKQVDITATHDGATWHAAFMRWDGAHLEGGIDHGATTSIVAGNVGDLTGNVKLGANYSSTKFFPGQIREVITWTTKPTDSDRTNILAVWNAAYGLSL